MPRVKTTRVKKSSPKKLSKPVASKAKTQTKKVSKEDASLHKAFIVSLTTLVTYWNKKSAQLKKQLDTLKAKQKTAKAKPSKATAKAKQASENLQHELAQVREAHTTAKLAAAKYVALSKMIKQFEGDWLKKQGEDQAAAPVSAVKKKTPKKAATPKKLPSESSAKKLKKGSKPQPETLPAFASQPEHSLAREALEEETFVEDDDLLFALEDEEDDEFVSELRIIEDASDELFDDEDSFDNYNS